MQQPAASYFFIAVMIAVVVLVAGTPALSAINQATEALTIR